MKQDMIVILDLGSHENTVLARAIRALGVYSEIYPHDITVEELKALPNVKGIIIKGRPNNVIDGIAIVICFNHRIADFFIRQRHDDKYSNNAGKCDYPKIPISLVAFVISYFIKFPPSIYTHSYPINKPKPKSFI